VLEVLESEDARFRFGGGGEGLREGLSPHSRRKSM
jgi:hypothetical protein